MPTKNASRKPYGSTVIWIDGEPGSGKTTFIGNSDDFDTVFTYSNSAANSGRNRFPEKTWKTIYKAMYPHAVRVVEHGSRMRYARSRQYDRSPISGPTDIELSYFTLDAPSRRRKTKSDLMGETLHGWRSGPCPIDLEEYREQLAEDEKPPYIYTLASWLNLGAPTIGGGQPYGCIGVDESQDVSFLEIRGMCALADLLYCFGDTGQALFGGNKGMDDSEHPPALQIANEVRKMDRSFRCGQPLAGIASQILAPYYDRGDSWHAKHRTSVRVWETPSIMPDCGLALGYSREVVSKYFHKWACRGVWVRAGGGADPNEELVMAVVHEAKGFQADCTYLLPWPRKRLIRLVQGDFDVLKQLYVMLTRTKKRCYVTREMMAAIELCLETRNKTQSQNAV